MIPSYIVFFIFLWIHGCRSQCAKENPFYMIDKQCANFNDVCVKKDSDPCKSLLQACAQCPTSNLTESALVNMLTILRDQRNTTTSHFDAGLNNLKSQISSSTFMVVIIIIAVCVIGFLIILLVLIHMRWQPFKLRRRNAGGSRDKEDIPLKNHKFKKIIYQKLENIENEIKTIMETSSGAPPPSKQKNGHSLANESSKFYILEINDPKSIDFNTESLCVIKKHTGQITIKSIFDDIKKVTLSYSNVESVGNVKNTIADSLGSPAENVILFCDNKYLDDDVFLFEIGIKQGRQLKFCHMIPLVDSNIIEHRPHGDTSMIYKYTDSEESVLKRYQLAIMEKFLKKSKTFLNELITFQRTKSHGGFVRLNGVFKERDYFYISMEKMEESIKDYIVNNHPLSEENIVKWAKQILSALKYLHDRDIPHYNIKPSSILLDKDKNIKLPSFGIAKYFRLGDMIHSKQGLQPSQKGTFRYMAPEHCKGQDSRVKSDVWSFGATMVEMATGKQPFDGKEEGQVIGIIGNTNGIPFKLDKIYSPELKEFIEKCLIKDPNTRATVDDLLNHPFLRTK